MIPLRHVFVHLMEIGRVARSIIGRHTHADEEYLRPRCTRRVDHLFQIGARLGNRQAAQSIVCTELEDDERRFVQLQGAGQSLHSTAGSFATHAGIDDRGYVPLFLQPFLQQRHPALAGAQAVTRTKTVPKHQYGRGLRGRALDRNEP